MINESQHIKFRSRKDILFGSVIMGINILLIVIMVVGILNGGMETHELWTIPLVFGVIFFLSWMYFDTYYLLSPNGLEYHCGPIRGSIRLERIREIVKGRTLWVGFRPATARKGLIVKFDKFNEIYISPKTNETFIDRILEFKSDIHITE